MRAPREVAQPTEGTISSAPTGGGVLGPTTAGDPRAGGTRASGLIRRSAGAGALLLLTGCTPLGGWLYDDPTFALSSVARRGGGASGDTLDVTLMACNRNEFELPGSEIELALDLQGHRTTRGRSERAFVLPLRDSIPLVVPVRLERPASAAGGGGEVRFTLMGRTTIRTPLGVRRVPFTESGALRVPGAAETTSVRRPAPVCRPGKSNVPGAPALPLPAPEAVPAPTASPNEPPRGEISRTVAPASEAPRDMAAATVAFPPPPPAPAQPAGSPPRRCTSAGGRDVLVFRTSGSQLHSPEGHR